MRKLLFIISFVFVYIGCFSQTHILDNSPCFFGVDVDINTNQTRNISCIIGFKTDDEYYGDGGVELKMGGYVDSVRTPNVYILIGVVKPTFIPCVDFYLDYGFFTHKTNKLNPNPEHLYVKEYLYDSGLCASTGLLIGYNHNEFKLWY